MNLFLCKRAEAIRPSKDQAEVIKRGPCLGIIS